MSVKFSKRTLLISLYSVGAALLLVAGVLWWDHRATDPQRVFWGTVEQSMKTSGVTVQATQTAANGSSMHQTVQYSMTGQNTTHTLTSLKQGETTVVDETIGTTTADYTRYTSIKTDQQSASGKPLNFSKVLGVWSKTGHEVQDSQQLSQAILGTNLPLGGIALPTAQLQPEVRRKLGSQIRKEGVYDISFKDAKREHRDGRLLYTYKVAIKPDKYALMMQAFGKATGLHTLDNLKPEQYAGQPAFTMLMTIDARAHRLIEARTEDGAVKQAYSGYDIPAVIKLPAVTISNTELQKRLLEIQQ